MNNLDGGGARIPAIIHELNNALGLVISYATLLSREFDDRPDVADDVAEIRSAGRLAADLVKELSAVLHQGGAST